MQLQENNEQLHAENKRLLIENAKFKEKINGLKQQVNTMEMNIKEERNLNISQRMHNLNINNSQIFLMGSQSLNNHNSPSQQQSFSMDNHALQLSMSNMNRNSSQQQLKKLYEETKKMKIITYDHKITGLKFFNGRLVNYCNYD